MRETLTLDGLWKFLLDPNDRGDKWFEYYRRESADPNLEFMRGFDKLLWREMQIPGCWNVHDSTLEWYEGVVWFAREFDLPADWAGKSITLRFGAVNYHARVWLNDVEIGEHEGGYTPFEFDVTAPLKPTGNLLMVKVHNRQLADSTCPLLPMTNYGGIYRSVNLTATGPARVQWLAILPDLDKDYKKATLTLKYEIANMGEKDRALRLKINLLDPQSKPLETVEAKVQTAAGKVTAGSLEVKVDRPLIWDRKTPHLYRAEAVLSEGEAVLDAVNERFGIRKVEVKEGKIHLNGRPVFLKGVGKHDEYPGLGRTIPDEIYKKDFAIIQKLNCNAVRMAHYPHDDRETALADELGLLLWEETLLVFDVDFKNPVVHKKVCQQLEELVRRDINHPSVILWSLGNEIPSTMPEAEKCLRAEAEVVRRLDPTRLVTFASWPLDIKQNKPLGFVDVISFNQYRGWYAPDIPGLAAEIQAYHETYPDKAIIVSEFGAGSMRGFHAGPADRWSEEFQERVLEENLSYLRKSPYLSGCFIWNYVDFKDPARPYTIYEPFLNNKGLLDEQRVPKKAYATVAKIFEEMGR